MAKKEQLDTFEYFDRDAKPPKWKTAYKCKCKKVWKYKTDLRKCIVSNHQYNNFLHEV